MGGLTKRERERENRHDMVLQKSGVDKIFWRLSAASRVCGLDSGMTVFLSNHTGMAEEWKGRESHPCLKLEFVGDFDWRKGDTRVELACKEMFVMLRVGFGLTRKAVGLHADMNQWHKKLEFGNFNEIFLLEMVGLGMAMMVGD